jgi:hypothetical protein
MVAYPSQTLPSAARPAADSSEGSSTAVCAILTDFILASGFVLAPSSQLRFPGIPIGLGELCFLLWLLMVLVRELKRGRVPLTGALRRLLVFWSLFAMSLSIGSIAAAAIGDRNDLKLVIHDAMAYPLLATVSLFSVLGPDAQARMHRVGLYVTALGALSLLLQLLQGWELFDISSLDPWYWDRFRGWSQNPNQLAFMSLVLALLSVYRLDRRLGAIGRLTAVVCVAVPVVAGWLTKSDTFSLALIAGTSAFAGIKILNEIPEPSRQLMLRSGLAWTVAFCFCALLTACLALSPLIVEKSEKVALSLAKNGGSEAASEADLRLSLWGTAISRGFESGLPGLGPGPHLPIPDHIVAARKEENEPKYVEHPEDNGTANFEAHNTYLDLFTQGGAIAVLCFLWLLGSCLMIAFRTRRAGLAALICGLAIFALASFVARQPFFWFAVALCLTNECGNKPPVADRIRHLRPCRIVD